MFDRTSRYASLPTATLTEGDHTITYVTRRFLPAADSHKLLVEVTVSEGDRTDLIASRTIGNLEQYWRIADMNTAMDPVELTDEPGAILRIPLPTV